MDLIRLKSVKEIANFIIKEARQELEIQGHNNTGELSKSLASEIILLGNDLEVEISAFLYGVFVDQGVRKERFKGGRLYIEVIKEWIVQKGLANSEKEVKNFAFAIRAKHQKEGIPTLASSSHSQNGKRLGWFTDTFKSIEPQILAKMERVLIDFSESAIDDVLSQAAAEFRKNN